MAGVIFVTVLVLSAVVGIVYARWRRRERRESRRGHYANCTTSESKYAEVEAAESVDELRAMWAAWRDQGWAEDGLLHRHIIQRIYHLGGQLSANEQELVRTLPAVLENGRNTPRIRGRGPEGVV